MDFSIKKTENRRLSMWVPAAFFVAYYLYVWLIIEPKLLYYAFGRTLPYYPFLLDRDFFITSFTSIGGPVTYLTGFLSQYFYFSWFGSLIITALGWMFWMLFSRVFFVTGTGYLYWTGYLFAVLPLAAYTSYDNQLFNFLSLLAALMAFLMYIRADRPRAISAVLFLLEFALVYYLAGDVVILFSLLAGLHELFIRGRKWLAVFFIMCLAAYCIWLYFFDYSLFHYTFSLMDILVILVLLEIIRHHSKLSWTVSSRLQQSRLMSACRKVMTAAEGVIRKCGKWQVRLYVKPAIPFVLLVLVFCISYNKTAKIFLELGYYCDQRQWEKALECAGRYPRPIVDFLSIHDINRALYHTGELAGKMFWYDQAPNALLLSYASSPSDSRIWAKLSRKMDTFLELGDLGDAQRYASEILESTNQCPYTLKQIALIHLAKHRNETAKVYLRVLAKDLIHGCFAKELLMRLQSDTQLADYEPVRYLRTVAVETDNVGEYDPDVFFSHALERNPQNKMAFEYMMAFYLAMGEVEKFVENMSRFKNFSYVSIPVHYQEAMLIYASSGGDIARLGNFKASPETIDRFRKFDEEMAALNSRGINKEGIKQALAEKFGDTYMYYFLFVLHGGDDA